MSIPFFQQWVNFQLGFGLENGRLWSFCKLQSFRSSSLISVATRIKSIQHRSKKIWLKYQNRSKYFHVMIFFHLWPKRISFFPFIFSHIFNSLNYSKTTSQLIFTLEFSFLCVCMLNLLVLISYNRKIPVMSIF